MSVDNFGLKFSISLSFCLSSLSLYLSDSLQDQVLASVSPVVSPLQSVPWGSSTRAPMWKRLWQTPWYENTFQHIYIYTLKETHNNSEHISLSCHHMQLTPPGLCVCMYVCVCVLTNPWFYLCLMLSAVGRHAVQGQLLLLPLTCVLCVF